MTIQEDIHQQLVGNGLFDSQADAVIELMKASKANAAMSERWGDSPGEYPPAIAILAWLSAKRAAVEWIDANAPSHWARPLFAEAEAGGGEMCAASEGKSPNDLSSATGAGRKGES